MRNFINLVESVDVPTGTNESWLSDNRDERDRSDSRYDELMKSGHTEGEAADIMAREDDEDTDAWEEKNGVFGMGNKLGFLEGSEEASSGKMSQDVSSHTAGDGMRLQGAYLDPSVIAEYFPSIKDQHAFNRAWRKVVANKEENLTRNESWELSRAFIDLVRMEKPDKLSFLRRVMLVHLSPESKGETTDTIYR